MIRMFAPALLFVFTSPLFCPAATWYVDDSVPTSGDGKSWETAFNKIQESIDGASDGDTVSGAFQVQEGQSGDWYLGVQVKPYKTAYVASLTCMRQSQ